MADGLIATGATGVDIDNSVVGTSAYRQRVVIGGDNSSGSLVNPSTVWPSSGAMGLPIRIIGSSGIVLGSVAQSSNWNLSTAAVVGLTTTAVVGLTTTSVVGLSSSLQNYITNSTTVPVYLGQSTSNIVGIVGLSSSVTLSSGTLTLGTLTTGTVVGLTTTSVVGLTTTVVVGLSSGTTQFGILGPSSANVIGTVAQSSNWNISTGAIINLSSGTLTLGTLTTGTVVLLTTGSVVGLTTTATVGLTTTSLVGLSTAAASITSQTTAGAVGSSAIFMAGGLVASTANTNATQSSGMAQIFQVDRSGAQTVNLEGPRQFVKTANLVTAANTSQQQIIAAPGAGLVTDIVAIEIFSTAASSTTLLATKITFYSSSGQADPGIWNTMWFYTLGFQPIYRTFPIPLTQLTANNPWFVVSSSSAAGVVNISVQYVVGTS